MRMMSRGVVLACLVAVAGAATAQPPGGRQGGGRGAPGGGGIVALFRSKTVQDEMKFTDEQKDKLREAVPKLQEAAGEKYQALFGAGGGRPDRAKMAEVQAEVAAMTYKEIGEIVTPEQLKRLKQIEIQVAGMRAYQLPTVAEAMKFTDDQKSKMQEINGDVQKEMRELTQEYDLQAPWMRPTDPEKAAEFDKKQAKINKDAAAKIDEILTDDQKAKFKELSGPTIDVAKVRAESAQPKKKKSDD